MGSALAASVLVALVGGAIATMPRGDRPALTPAGDSAIGAAIRDTLLLVRFAITAPNAARVAVVGDFNGWQAGTTLLARDERGAWRADVALSRGTHRYAFVVDDTQWVADTAAPASIAPDGRAASRLVIPAPE
jgi:1,4-alpha-glucan branching enzyme